jgi:hypothetical protein
MALPPLYLLFFCRCLAADLMCLSRSAFPFLTRAVLAMATVAVMEQWAADPQAPASTSAAAAAAAQMPFLALLQGAGIMVDQGHHQDGRKRNAADLDLLESCVTQAAAAAPVAYPAPTTRAAERRRKRPRPCRARAAPPPAEKRRKPEEAENQRMTHIAVERNRRRLMNDHLASLRSLIPSSYIPRVSPCTRCDAKNHAIKRRCLPTAFPRC